MTELRVRLAEVMYNKYESNFVRGATFVHTWQNLLDEIERPVSNSNEAASMNLEIRDEWLSIADAVIEELNLTRQTQKLDDGSAWSFTGPGGEVTSGFKPQTEQERYVTEWVTPA